MAKKKLRPCPACGLFPIELRFTYSTEIVPNHARTCPIAHPELRPDPAVTEKEEKA